jgi:hypothetical protein
MFLAEVLRRRTLVAVVKAGECLIALGNLRAAAHAWVLPEGFDTDADVLCACAVLASELAGGDSIALLGERSLDAEVAIERLVDAVSGALSVFRGRPFDERAMGLVGSLENSVAIARAVLRVSRGLLPQSGVHRTTRPPRPLGQTGT